MSPDIAKFLEGLENDALNNQSGQRLTFLLYHSLTPLDLSPLTFYDRRSRGTDYSALKAEVHCP